MWAPEPYGSIQRRTHQQREEVHQAAQQELPQWAQLWAAQEALAGEGRTQTWPAWSPLRGSAPIAYWVGAPAGLLGSAYSPAGRQSQLRDGQCISALGAGSWLR